MEERRLDAEKRESAMAAAAEACETLRVFRATRREQASGTAVAEQTLALGDKTLVARLSSCAAVASHSARTRRDTSAPLAFSTRHDVVFLSRRTTLV